MTRAPTCDSGGADFFIDGSNATASYDGTTTDEVGQHVSIANTTGGTKALTGANTAAERTQQITGSVSSGGTVALITGPIGTPA